MHTKSQLLILLSNNHILCVTIVQINCKNDLLLLPPTVLSVHQAKVRELQQELADSLKKQSMSEAFLEVNTRYRKELEEEKSRLSKDLERLRGKVPMNL